ncbi:McrC family protein [Arthrobacter bussei]|uniref:Restriction endonuclease n=1 Tax=Arthrobacter bussei TaxID=2594179 RepID=A0A7X1NSV3_9MICC|nr:hypothetical protein [Arthrobacter bussei]MPY12287.1 hypothetical protein [Arthrobacter bussei]
MTADEQAEDKDDFAVLKLREFESRTVPAELILNEDRSLNIYEDVLQRALVTVTVKGGSFRLQAGQYVGVVPINARCVLHIEPRTPLANLTAMVKMAGYDPEALVAMRTYGVSAESEQWMRDLLADALLEAVFRIRENGMLRSYERRSDESSMPRGRININETITALASRGINHRVRFSWFERTVDTPENRCLKSALLELAREYTDPLTRGKSGNRERVRRISTALHMFAEVTDDRRRDYLNSDVVQGFRRLPDPRAYYKPALSIALRILRKEGLLLEEPGAAVLETSLLVNMGHIFEQYVRARLQRHAEESFWTAEVLDGNLQDGRLALYSETTAEERALAPDHQPPKGVTGSAAMMTPDIVFRRNGTTFPMVADVKNKVPKGDMPSRDDVEQVATYGLRYGSKYVFLVYPRSGIRRAGMQPVGNLGPITVFQYHYDLAASDMDNEAQAFGSAVQRLLAASPQSP